MRNIINGKTLHESQVEKGLIKGMEEFLTRCTGTTTGEVLGDISKLMQGDVKEVVYNPARSGPQLSIFRESIQRMGLKGFNEQPNVHGSGVITITYLPFSID